MKKELRLLSLVMALTISLHSVSMVLIAAGQRPDLLIADFEAENYGNWVVEGDAFGQGPVKGTFPNQMSVTGYQGERLVNSYYHGDDTQGKLTSSTFKIERNYLVFLIGGGGYEDVTCIRLLVDGKQVCQATGDNVVPGGSEKLDWKSWDVRELQGKQAIIEIVDHAIGGWGHINIDQIMQSDTAKGTIVTYSPKVTLSRDFLVNKPFLHVPVKTGNPKKWLQLVVDKKVVREFEIEMADGDADFNATFDITPWQEKTVTLNVEKMPDGSKALDAVILSDVMANQVEVYTESLRPLYHFTVRHGWINDPNGLLYYDGEYHMFSQNNPCGINWGNMTWSHAVSKDLVHWKQLSDALYPDEQGTMFSGSGIVDHANTSGFQMGKEKPLVLIYTAAGGTNRLSNDRPFTQGIAYSNDRGLTWIKYEGNPVLKHIEGGNRDPKVFWHEPSKQWVMALYLDREDYALFSSSNLKEWSKLCDIRNLGCSECPDMFELAVDGNANNKKWVFWGGNGMYLIGTFDGKKFQPESKPLRIKYGGSEYAAQTWSNIPEKDGRRIQIAWMNNWGTGATYFPNMPFNQQYTVPRMLTLHTTKDGIRMFVNPIEELKTLRMPETLVIRAKNVTLQDGKTVEYQSFDRAVELEFVIAPQTAKEFEIGVPGVTLVYDAAEKKLGPIPVEPIDGKIKLQLFLDRSSLEVFANDGVSQHAICFPPEDVKTDNITITAKEGDAMLESITIWPLRGIWEK